jgi:hypothetical protein
LHLIWSQNCDDCGPERLVLWVATSTALISVQKLYNIQEKISFYPGYIVQAEELLEDLNEVNNEEDLQKIQDRFRKMRVEEAAKRPIENSSN